MHVPLVARLFSRSSTVSALFESRPLNGSSQHSTYTEKRAELIIIRPDITIVDQRIDCGRSRLPQCREEQEMVPCHVLNIFNASNS